MMILMCTVMAWLMLRVLVCVVDEVEDGDVSDDFGRSRGGVPATSRG